MVIVYIINSYQWNNKILINTVPIVKGLFFIKDFDFTFSKEIFE